MPPSRASLGALGVAGAEHGGAAQRDPERAHRGRSELLQVAPRGDHVLALLPAHRRRRLAGQVREPEAPQVEGEHVEAPFVVGVDGDLAHVVEAPRGEQAVHDDQPGPCGSLLEPDAWPRCARRPRPGARGPRTGRDRRSRGWRPRVAGRGRSSRCRRAPCAPSRRRSGGGGAGSPRDPPSGHPSSARAAARPEAARGSASRRASRRRRGSLSRWPSSHSGSAISPDHDVEQLRRAVENAVGAARGGE